MPMQWNDQADARLFANVLKLHVVKLDYPSLAKAMGNGVTPKAISHRISKIKEKASAYRRNNPYAFEPEPATSKKKKPGRTKAAKAVAVKGQEMEDDAEPVKQEKSSYVKMETEGPKEGWDASSVDLPFLSPPPPGGSFFGSYEPQTTGFGASAEREMVQAFAGHDAAQEFVGATGVQEYGSADGADDHDYAVGGEGGYVGENPAGFGGASLGRDAVQRDEHGGYAHSADNV